MAGWIFTKSLQLTLSNLGYMAKDQADGKFGPKTKAALEKAVGALGIPYKSSRAVFNLQGVVLNPLSAYLGLVEASAKGKAAPKPAAKPPEPAAKPPAKPTPAKIQMAKASVLDLQKIVVALGSKIKKDGLYGPKTAGAWQVEAKKRGLNTTIKRVTGKQASVALVTFNALKKAATAKPAAPTVTTVKVKVLDIQKVLNRLGAGLKTDGLYGPKTAGAFQKIARSRNLNGAIKRVSGKVALIPSSTWSKLKSEPSAAKPVPPPAKKAEWEKLPAGTTVEKPIIELQRILYKLGNKLKLDGLYGPKTAGAWKQSAEKLGLNGKIWRVTGKKARVMAKAFKTMNAEAYKPKKPTPAPAPKPKPAGQPGQGYSSKEVQTLLVELGYKIKADNIWGKKSRGALKSAAAKHGFRYLSSSGYSTKSSMVRVNPGYLIPKLQGILTARRKQEAVDAAKKSKAEAEAKKKAAAAAEKRRFNEAAKAEAARKKREAAETEAKKKKAAATKKEEEALRAAEKARQTKKEADRKEAARKQKEAQEAEAAAQAEIARAKEQQRIAAAQEAAAEVASKQADVAKQEARESKQDVNVTIHAGREAVQEARQQEASPEVQKAPMVKAAAVPGAMMMLVVGGVVALAAAVMMGKKGGGPPAEWFEDE